MEKIYLILLLTISFNLSAQSVTEFKSNKCTFWVNNNTPSVSYDIVTIRINRPSGNVHFILSSSDIISLKPVDGKVIKGSDSMGDYDSINYTKFNGGGHIQIKIYKEIYKIVYIDKSFKGNVYTQVYDINDMYTNKLK
jgi:hypothetical protein